jgi:hypothetical protein
MPVLAPCPHIMCRSLARKRGASRGQRLYTPQSHPVTCRKLCHALMQ